MCVFYEFSNRVYKHALIAPPREFQNKSLWRVLKFDELLQVSFISGQSSRKALVHVGGCGAVVLNLGGT